MRRLLGTALAALLACLLGGGVAHASTLVMTGDSTTVRGYIGLQVYASADFTTVQGGELVDGQFVPLTTFDMRFAGVIPPFGPMNVGFDQRVAPWDCARRDRTFMSVGRTATGATQSATFNFRTPSCKHRLQMRLPDRVRPRRTVHAIIRDSFRIGGVDARFCARGPGRRASCRILSFPPGVTKLSTAFRVPRKGRYRINLASGPQRVKRVVSAGLAPRPKDLAHLPTVLTTGDSMMQTVDQVLGDRLDGRINLASDVKISSGITKPFITDWARLPGKQVRRFGPDVAIVYLGANEDGTLTPPGGSAISCCGAAWRAEYARRARQTMETYIGSDGEGAAIWLLNPVPGDPRRAPVMAAVNDAVIQAARGLDRVRLVDLYKVFTPDGVYRDDLNGVRVRQDDRIHFSLAGARFAVKPIIAALDDLGALR